MRWLVQRTDDMRHFVCERESVDGCRSLLRSASAFPETLMVQLVADGRLIEYPNSR